MLPQACVWNKSTDSKTGLHKNQGNFWPRSRHIFKSLKNPLF